VVLRKENVCLLTRRKPAWAYRLIPRRTLKSHHHKDPGEVLKAQG